MSTKTPGDAVRAVARQLRGGHAWCPALAIAGLIVATPVAASQFMAVAVSEAEAVQDVGAVSATKISFHDSAEETGQASARASGGNLSAFAGAYVFASGTDEFRSVATEARADAIMTITGVLLSGPGTSIVTSYNLHIAGALFLECGGDYGSALFSFESSIVDPDTQAALFMNGAVSRPEFNCLGEQYTGIFQGPGFDGDAIVTSTTGAMPTGVPLTLNGRMTVIANAGGYLGGGSDAVAANATASFENTVSFPRDGPVFNLPAGYTANSADGFIVDNRWEPVPAAPVGTQLAIGLLWLLPSLRTIRASRPRSR